MGFKPDKKIEDIELNSKISAKINIPTICHLFDFNIIISLLDTFTSSLPIPLPLPAFLLPF
jgi:hypothetical protein